MKTARLTLLAALLSLVSTGCGYAVQTAMFRPAYPPTSALDVYRGNPPARPYVELAQLRTADQWNAMARIVEKAKAIGADAIILLPRKYAGTDVSSLDTSQSITPIYDIVVVAIKYK
ncbi:MAG: hypothetical protein M1550_00150 [Deltaproteobacteria bacterium]|nr:hypothetical protein [Deltaproteobacteria bacterium]